MNRYLSFFLFVLSLSSGVVFAQSSETGLLSVYADLYQGRQTASGALYDAGQLTAAHASLPFGTVVRVANFGSGRMVDVQINDRKAADGRIVTLSRAAAEALQLPGNAVSQGSLLVVAESAPRTSPVPVAAGGVAAGGMVAAAGAPEPRKFQPFSGLFNKDSATKTASVYGYSYPEPNLPTQAPVQYGIPAERYAPPMGQTTVANAKQAKSGLLGGLFQGKSAAEGIQPLPSGAGRGDLIPMSANSPTQGAWANPQYPQGSAPQTIPAPVAPAPTMLASPQAPYRAQFGAFRRVENADELAGMLKGAAVPVSVYSDQSSGLNLVVTDAGFPTAEEAQRWIDYEAARRGWVERPVVIR
jgi:cell division septation protein DedD